MLCTAAVIAAVLAAVSHNLLRTIRTITSKPRQQGVLGDSSLLHILYLAAQVAMASYLTWKLAEGGLPGAEAGAAVSCFGVATLATAARLMRRHDAAVRSLFILHYWHERALLRAHDNNVSCSLSCVPMYQQILPLLTFAAVCGAFRCSGEQWPLCNLFLWQCRRQRGGSCSSLKAS